MLTFFLFFYVLHFGNLTTSAVESSHANIKIYLDNSTGDLKTLFSRLNLFWRNQKADFDARRQRGLYKTKINSSILFANIVSSITPQCLSLLNEELRKVPGTPPPTELCHQQCNCTLNHTHALPCWHKMWVQLHMLKPFEKKDIHSFWLWDRLAADTDLREHRRRSYSPVRDPVVVRGKGRPKEASYHRRNYGASSTRRDPSLHEVEGLVAATTPARISSPARTSPRWSPAPSSTMLGLQRLERTGDSYEPGTDIWRNYQRAAARHYEPELDVPLAGNVLCCIDSDFEAQFEGVVTGTDRDDQDDEDFIA